MGNALEHTLFYKCPSLEKFLEIFFLLFSSLLFSSLLFSNKQERPKHIVVLINYYSFDFMWFLPPLFNDFILQQIHSYSRFSNNNKQTNKQTNNNNNNKQQQQQQQTNKQQTNNNKQQQTTTTTTTFFIPFLLHSLR